MNFEEDKAWEQRIDRALKSLPELTAPGGLVEKTMAVLESQKKPSWRHQPWPMWPFWMRSVSLAVMLTFVGALAVLGTMKGDFARALLGQPLVHRLIGQFSSLGVVLETLGRAAVTVACHLNGWLIILFVVAATTAYLACIGLGTAAVRLALSRR
jgi:hypothetical protein